MPEFPNMFIIGAPRSGTTSLYEYLNAHPDIYMSPVKEPDFFSRNSLDVVHGPHTDGPPSPDEAARAATELQADLDQYLALFAGAKIEKIRGEASAIYLGHPTAAMHLHHYVPNAKLIAILRDPAERFHSHYVHAKRIYSEFPSRAPRNDGDVSLEDQVAAVVTRAAQEGFAGPGSTDPEVWLRSGFYFRHLTRFQSLYPKEQLRVFLFEQLVHDAQGLVSEILRFLDVDPTFVLPTTAAFNASVTPRSRGLFRFFTTRNPIMRAARAAAPTQLRAIAMGARNRALAAGKPSLDLEQRRQLISIYRDDILQLQGLLGKDLSAWLQTPGKP